jgi:hypothetical protein
MDNVFLILFFLFLISTIVIFIKPSRFLKNKTEPEIKRAKIGLIILTILFFTLFGITTDTSKSDKISTNQTASKQTQDTEAKNSVTPTVKKTDQQVLEENLSSIVNSTSGSDMSYRSLQLEKSDPDRPQDAKMITVSIDVKSFFDKNSLLRNTGKLSSAVFKAVYNASSIKAYDVLVWYYGETTDRYGNKKKDVVLTYAIDKTTFEKINWQNFDQSSLCDFLKQEAKASGTFDTACNVLVNIQ